MTSDSQEKKEKEQIVELEEKDLSKFITVKVRVIKNTHYREAQENQIQDVSVINVSINDKISKILEMLEVDGISGFMVRSGKVLDKIK